MKVFAIAAVLLATPAAAGPLDGTWFHECGADTGGDRVPIVINGREIVRYESACQMTGRTPIGTQERAWHVAARCTGEGETWEENDAYAIVPAGSGRSRQLVIIDMTDGFVNAYWSCD